jgi:hypothetical protein
VYQNAVLPVARAIENGANFVGRTMGAAGRAIGRGVMATLRGIGGAAYGAYRGFLGGVRAVSHAITGGASWADTIREAGSVGKDWLKGAFLLDWTSGKKRYDEGVVMLPPELEALSKATVVGGSAALAVALGGYAALPYLAATGATASAAGSALTATAASEAGGTTLGMAMTMGGISSTPLIYAGVNFLTHLANEAPAASQFVQNLPAARSGDLAEARRRGADPPLRWTPQNDLPNLGARDPMNPDTWRGGRGRPPSWKVATAAAAAGAAYAMYRLLGEHVDERK